MTILFTASSGNVAVGTVAFGPGKSAAVGISWENEQSQADMDEFDAAAPALFEAAGFNITGSITSVKCEDSRHAEAVRRKFFAEHNRS